MSEDEVYIRNYNLGCDLAIAVLKENGREGAIVLLNSICSKDCPISRGVKDTARACINGGSPTWLNQSA